MTKVGASRTATRSNRNSTIHNVTGDKNDSVYLKDGHSPSNATFNGKPVVTAAYQQDVSPVKKLGDDDSGGNDAFPFIQENERKMQYKRKRKAFPISTVIFMK